MCGNFGLLSLGAGAASADTSSHHEKSFHKQQASDASLHESMHEVAKTQGMRYQDQAADDDSAKQELINPLKILEAQTACTEIRGGQAGGFSTIEYKFTRKEHESRYEAMFNASIVAVPEMTRVRMVARKRHPLAADLADLYLRHRGGKSLDPKSAITGIILYIIGVAVLFGWVPGAHFVLSLVICVLFSDRTYSLRYLVHQPGARAPPSRVGALPR